MVLLNLLLMLQLLVKPRIVWMVHCAVVYLEKRTLKSNSKTK